MAFHVFPFVFSCFSKLQPAIAAESGEVLRAVVSAIPDARSCEDQFGTHHHHAGDDDGAQKGFIFMFFFLFLGSDSMVKQNQGGILGLQGFMGCLWIFFSVMFWVAGAAGVGFWGDVLFFFLGLLQWTSKGFWMLLECFVCLVGGARSMLWVFLLALGCGLVVLRVIFSRVLEGKSNVGC